MTSRWLLALISNGLTFVVQAIDLRLNRDKISHTSSRPNSGQQKIEDHGDSYLTIRIDVGYQTLRMIPDSGSFDIYLIDGDDCRLQLCKPAYRPKFSRSHKDLVTSGIRRDIYFGSGACSVALAYDQVRVHDDNVKDDFVQQVKQRQLVPLWQIDSMDDDMLSVWGDGAGFQGIVGLGFKGGAGRTHDEISRERLAAAELGAPLPSTASNLLFTSTFAICLPRGDVANALGGEETETPTSRGEGKQGMLWWGEAALPALNWTLTAEVVGERHWTLQLNQSVFTDAKSGENLHTFCQPPCAALIDSGTSLMAMSSQFIDDILDKTPVGRLNEDCSNIDEMPDLAFTLTDGKKLVLSPDSYVMRISPSLLSLSGKVTIGKGKVIVLRRKPETAFLQTAAAYSPDDPVCTYAFMESPISQALVKNVKHDVMIMGIPVFREYTIKFDRERETLAFAQHAPGEDCDGLTGSTPASFAQSSKGQRETKARDIRVIKSLESLRFPVF